VRLATDADRKQRNVRRWALASLATHPPGASIRALEAVGRQRTANSTGWYWGVKNLGPIAVSFMLGSDSDFDGASA